MLLDAYRRTLGLTRRGFHQTKPQEQKPQPVCSLPTELWEVILDQVLAIPFLLATDCSPVDFYFFAMAHRAWDAASAQRESYGERWRTLRAVCRRWKAIVDKQSNTWIRLNSSTSNWGIPPETKRVDIVLSAASDFRSDTISRISQTAESAFGNVQVISVSEYCGPTQDSPELLPILDTVARSKAPVNSFIYEGDARLYPTHFQAITDVFSHLTSLTLHARGINGTLAIPTLNALWISASTFDISRWDLPSLRHLALGDPRETVRSIRYEDMNIESSIKDRLLSIMILYPYWFAYTRQFWAEHSSLQFIGAPNIRNKPNPKMIHDARILCITGSMVAHKSHPPEGFFLYLPQFRYLQTLITPNKDIMRSKVAVLQDVKKYCAANNITWYVGHNQQFEQLSEKPKRGGYMNIFR